MKTLAALVTPAVLLLSTLASPTQAGAGTLAFTSGSCDQTTAGSYTAHLECDFRWTGANGQVGVTFTGTNGSINSYSYIGANEVYATGTCLVLHTTTITATITDSVSSASRTVALTCQHEVP